MKESLQLSLAQIARLRHSDTGIRLLNEKEIGLKISRINNTRIGEVSSIELPEEPWLNSIVAVDVSTVKVGISSMGEVYAVRGATVLKEKGSVKVRRTKPMVILGEISDSQFCFELEEQLKNTCSVSGSIILIDGDLSEIMSVSKSLRLLEFLKSTGNFLISVSKGLMHPLMKLPEELDSSPFVGELLNDRSSREYLVRLELGSPLLRVGVYPEIDIDELSSLLASLIIIDGVEYGYPETLRIAHIYSKILPVEVLTLRCLLQKKYGIEVFRGIDNRKMLLGGFWS
ncbi:MAG: hypothetical protein ACUVQ0_03705 [Thermoproteota archaeon]